MKIIVYGRPNCVQCDATERLLKTLGHAFDKVDLSEDVGAVSYLAERGYRSLPVVEVDGALEWSGFDPGKLRALKERQDSVWSEA